MGDSFGLSCYATLPHRYGAATPGEYRFASSCCISTAWYRKGPFWLLDRARERNSAPVNMLKGLYKIAITLTCCEALRALLLGSYFSPVPAFADDPGAQLEQEASQDQGTLLPSLGRDWLAEQGVSLELIAINDNFANVRGGVRRGVGSMGNLNVIFTIDTAKAGWWENGSFTIYGIWLYGQRPSEWVGDFQFTSSIDGPVPELEPYEAYYEHTFMDGRLKWLAGIHDLTLDFATLDFAFNYINSSFTTPSTITQLPYSFYPNTSWGTRGIYRVTEELYAMLGFYDGQPATADNLSTSNLGITAEDGIYSIAEFGYKGSLSGYYTKLLFGAWHCSGKFTDVAGDLKHSNFGTYLLGERELWHENELGDQGLGAFFQVGQSQQDRNLNPWYFGFGGRYKGLVPSREDDVLSVGLAMAYFGDTAQTAIPGLEQSERTFEINYRAPVTSWLTLSPDVQFVIDPYGNPDLENDLILYVRSEVTL